MDPAQQKRTRGARDPGTSAPGARRAICFGTNAISERTLGKGSEYLDDLRSGDWVALITSLVKIASTLFCFFSVLPWDSSTLYHHMRRVELCLCLNFFRTIKSFRRNLMIVVLISSGAKKEVLIRKFSFEFLPGDWWSPIKWGSRVVLHSKSCVIYGPLIFSKIRPANLRCSKEEVNFASLGSQDRIPNSYPQKHVTNHKTRRELGSTNVSIYEYRW